jgi:flagellar motor switch protein FliN
MSTQHTIAEDVSPLAEFAAELTPPPLVPPAAAEVRESQSHEQLSKSQNPDFIMRLPVTLRVVLGTATMTVSALTKLGKGALVPLDRKIGDPVDVLVNGRVVARGEIVVADEATSRFGIKLTEVGAAVEQDR